MTKVPDNWSKLTIKQKVKWINANHEECRDDDDGEISDEEN